MAAHADVVFLIDVDNTLLDNDRVTHDLKDYLRDTLGEGCRDRYFEIFEALRAELGYTDYLGTLQRLRNVDRDNPRLLEVSSFLVDYPFAQRVFPDVDVALERLASRGPTVILSDGDVVFQPRKIRRSGLWDTVHGRVLIYIHKEQMLDAVKRHYPAAHYVMIDDKVRILAAMKQAWGDALTTVFVRQGHYALDRAQVEAYPAADVTIERIGDLRDIDLERLAPQRGRTV